MTYPTNSSGRVAVAQTDAQGAVESWAFIAPAAVEAHLRLFPGSVVISPEEAAKLTVGSANTVTGGVVTSDPAAGLAALKAGTLLRITTRQLGPPMLTPDAAKAAIAKATSANEIASIEARIRW